MATADLGRATEQLPWRGSVFGLTIEATEPIRNVPRAVGPLAKSVTWRRLGHDDARPWATAETLVDLHRPGGAAFMSVERGTAGSFRVAAPGFGEHFVAAAGYFLVARVPPHRP